LATIFKVDILTSSQERSGLSRYGKTCLLRGSGGKNSSIFRCWRQEKSSGKRRGGWGSDVWGNASSEKRSEKMKGKEHLRPKGDVLEGGNLKGESPQIFTTSVACKYSRERAEKRGGEGEVCRDRGGLGCNQKGGKKTTARFQL